MLQNISHYIYIKYSQFQNICNNINVLNFFSAENFNLSNSLPFFFKFLIKTRMSSSFLFVIALVNIAYYDFQVSKN